MIVIEGNGWGNNYNGFPGPWDGNLVMSFQKSENRCTHLDVVRALIPAAAHQAAPPR